MCFFSNLCFPPSHTGISSLLPPDQFCSLSHSSYIYCFPHFQFSTSCLFPPVLAFSSPLTALQFHSFMSFPPLLFTACLMIHKKDTTRTFKWRRVCWRPAKDSASWKPISVYQKPFFDTLSQVHNKVCKTRSNKYQLCYFWFICVYYSV